MADQSNSLTAICTICEHAPAQPKERLPANKIPKQPWAKVGMDLFNAKERTIPGNFWLPHWLLWDQWVLWYYLSNGDQGHKERVHKTWSATDRVVRWMATIHIKWSPQFRQDIQHTSSPYNSQSNGKAESAFKFAKCLLKRSRDPYRALLEWRNTPTAGLGSSPAQRLLWRQTQAAVPTNPKLKADPKSQIWKLRGRHKDAKTQASRICHHWELVNQSWFKICWQEKHSGPEAVVWISCQTDNNYGVNVDGQFLCRNHMLLRPTVNQPDKQPDSDGEGEYEGIETQAMQNSSSEQSITATERMVQTAPTEGDTGEWSTNQENEKRSESQWDLETMLST